jgi:peptidoglycan/LPS O-acetylase OafA/YrhL
MIAVQKWSWRNTLVMLGIIEITFRFPWSMLFGHTSDLELQPWLDFPFAYWWSWAIGAWIAYDWLADRRLPLAHLPIWLPVIATIICWEFRPLNNYTFMTGALAMAVWLSQKLEAKFVNTASHRSSQFKVLVSRFCIVVGGWSYSLYLLHQPFINLISRLYQREILVHGIVLLGMTFFTTLLITIPMAWFSYKWIELPGIELGKQN